MKYLFLAAALAYAAITPALADVVVPPEAIDQYKAHCAEEWTKRGVLNAEMFDYCVSQEQDGYAKMVEVINKYSSRPWIQALLDHIVHQWTKRGVRQDSMVGYNLSLETDAYEDMVYETKQPSFNKDKMTACYLSMASILTCSDIVTSKTLRPRSGQPCVRHSDSRTCFLVLRQRKSRSKNVLRRNVCSMVDVPSLEEPVCLFIRNAAICFPIFLQLH
jgi:hypothetical protein